MAIDPLHYELMARLVGALSCGHPAMVVTCPTDADGRPIRLEMISTPVTVPMLIEISGYVLEQASARAQAHPEVAARLDVAVASLESALEIITGGVGDDGPTPVIGRA